jgi:hypothetical protein
MFPVTVELPWSLLLQVVNWALELDVNNAEAATAKANDLMRYVFFIRERCIVCSIQYVKKKMHPPKKNSWDAGAT